MQSSFHHLADYNWDIDLGCPTFVTENPGIGYKEDPAALNDIKSYVANVARWLTPNGGGKDFPPISPFLFFQSIEPEAARSSKIGTRGQLPIVFGSFATTVLLQRGPKDPP